MEGKTKMTQGEEILDYLKKHETITRFEAACELHIFELSSRIGELEKKGHVFSKKRCTAKNKNGRKTHFTIYKLEGENNELAVDAR